MQQKQRSAAAAEFSAKMDETVAYHNAYIVKTVMISQVQNWKWENINK